MKVAGDAGVWRLLASSDLPCVSAAHEQVNGAFECMNAPIVRNRFPMYNMRWRIQIAPLLLSF